MLGNFYEDFMGLEGASGQRCGPSLSKERSSPRLRRREAPLRRSQPRLRQHPGVMVQTPSTEAPTPPLTTDVEAGPAEAGPGEGAAVPRHASKAAGRRGRA